AVILSDRAGFATVGAKFIGPREARNNRCLSSVTFLASISTTGVSLGKLGAISKIKSGGKMSARMKLAMVVCGLAAMGLPQLGRAQTEPLNALPSPPLLPQAAPAPGEPTVEGQTVAERARPEVDPIGLRAGDFFFYPRAELDESFNDNILATSSHQTGDFLTTFAPSFDILSNLPTNG